MKTKNICSLALSLLIISCSTSMPNSTGDNKTSIFNKKSIQSTEKGVYFYGAWDDNLSGVWVPPPISSPNPNFSSEIKEAENLNNGTINDVVDGFSASLNTLFPNTTISDYPYVSKFSDTSETTALNSNLIKSNGISSNLEDTPTNASFGDLHPNFNFQTTSDKQQSDGKPAIMQNDGTGVNNANVIKNLTYHSGNNSYPWDINMPDGWKTKDSYTYNYDKNKNSFITFEFKGSNVSLYMKNGNNPGWNKVKVSLYRKTYDGYETEPFKVVPGNETPIDNSQYSIIKINALELNNYKVKIESDSVSRSTGKVSFLYGFDKALVYPSIQKLYASENNFFMRYFSLPNMGLVDVTLKDIYTGEILYYSRVNMNTSKSTLQKSFDTDKSFYAIIEATGKRIINNQEVFSESDTGFNISYFSVFPFLSKNFVSNHIAFRVNKNPSGGLVDIYIDGMRKKTIDLYSPTSIYDIEQIRGLGAIGHNFKFVSAYDKNVESGTNRYEANLDAIGTSIAYYYFQTTNNPITSLTFSANKAPDQGEIQLNLIDLSNTNRIGTEAILDLYSSNNTGFKDKATYSFLGILDMNKPYAFVISPKYTKNISSSDFKINIDNVSFNSTVSVNPDGTPINLRSGDISPVDTICTP